MTQTQHKIQNLRIQAETLAYLKSLDIDELRTDWVPLTAIQEHLKIVNLDIDMNTIANALTVLDSDYIEFNDYNDGVCLLLD